MKDTLIIVRTIQNYNLRGGFFGIANNEKCWCVYVHTNKINGKKYVGITCQNPKDRWSNGKGYKDNKYFWRAIQKYGWDNFKHEVLLTNETLEFACRAERCLIKAYSCKAPNGYNLTDGGEGLDSNRFSNEARRKISESNKGDKNPFYGKRHSETSLNDMKVSRNKNKDLYNKKIYCVELDMYFDSSADAGKFIGMHYTAILDSCKENWRTASEFHWMFAEDVTKEKIQKILNNEYKRKQYTSVYCIELNQYFRRVKHAEEELSICHAHILSCCNGKLKSAGKHPITKEKLHWRYATKDEDKQYMNELCKKYKN